MTPLRKRFWNATGNKRAIGHEEKSRAAKVKRRAQGKKTARGFEKAHPARSKNITEAKMGKPTGFIDYDREVARDVSASDRTHTSDYFHKELGDAARTQQAARCMDCGVPFCQAGMQLGKKLVGCPLRNLIPEWNDQLYHGQLERALERLLRTNCFPEFTGYVCPAPCERWCSAGKVSDPVTINDNERYIIEEAYREGLIVPRVPDVRSGRRVAVVGSGPAGLTVATLLNQRGHEVVVFEREQTPGGLLVYGIPNMKLPKAVVARRIDILKTEGITFECGIDVGGACAGSGAAGAEKAAKKSISVSDLQKEFDAVVLAHGAHDPRVVPFEGWAQGVCFALEYRGAAARSFLGEAKLPAALNAKGKVVAVIGAGNSANDCIATALRQGAKDIMQLIRRPAADYGAMTDYAHEEANAAFDHDIRMFETQVAAVSGKKASRGAAKGAASSSKGAAAAKSSKAAASASGKTASSTSKAAAPALTQLTLTTPEGEKTVNADMLVIASGFKGSQEYVAASADAKRKNLFVAGDANIGSSLVVRAMADARNTARATDTFLMGYTSIS